MEDRPSIRRPADPVTLYPLNEDQLERLRTNLPNFPFPSERWKEPPDPKQVVYVLWRTGFHVSILCNPKRWGVRVADGFIEWKRPKTKAHAKITLHADIRGFVAEFFETLPIRSAIAPSSVGVARDVTVPGQAPKFKQPIDLGYVYYTRMVKAVGEFVGVPGLSPRTLRHQFIADMFEATGGDIPLVVQIAGTSAQTVLNYAKARSIKKIPALEQGSW